MGSRNRLQLHTSIYSISKRLQFSVARFALNWNVIRFGICVGIRLVINDEANVNPLLQHGFVIRLEENTNLSYQLIALCYIFEKNCCSWRWFTLNTPFPCYLLWMFSTFYNVSRKCLESGTIIHPHLKANEACSLSNKLKDICPDAEHILLRCQLSHHVRSFRCCACHFNDWHLHCYINDTNIYIFRVYHRTDSIVFMGVLCMRCDCFHLQLVDIH